MLISKFNKIVRSRVLWTIFAIIISVCFVGTFTESGGCTFSGSTAGNNAYGKPVASQDISLARYFEMGFRKASDITPEMETMLNRKAWERVAMLGLAEKMKISASDAEVDNAIRTDPAFSADGVFSVDKLKQIIERQLGMDMQTFRLYFRQELVLRKLTVALSAASLVSPYEMNSKISTLSDNFTVQYATLSRSSMTDKPKASRNDALTFFNDNKERFRIPEKVTVRYLTFPASNYLAKAEPAEDQLKEYYDLNKDTEFTSTDTNGIETVTSFDEAKKRISKNLKKSLALDMAKNSALEFVVDLQADKYGKSLTVSEALKKYNITPTTSLPFSEYDAPEWSDAGSETIRAAFTLDFSQTNSSCSDVIEGEENVYVLIPVAKKESYLPDFEEIEAKVTPIATTNIINKAFLEYAGKARSSVTKSMSEGKNFAEAAKSAGMKVKTTDKFNVYSGITNDNDYADIITGAVMNLEKGEVSEPYLSKDAAVLCYVADRTPAQVIDTEMMRPEVASALERYRSAVIINEWRKKVLSESGVNNVQSILTGESAPEEPES